MCLLFARKEKILGEIDRARAIYVHASQFCNPAKEKDFWEQWKRCAALPCNCGSAC